MPSWGWVWKRSPMGELPEKHPSHELADRITYDSELDAVEAIERANTLADLGIDKVATQREAK